MVLGHRTLLHGCTRSERREWCQFLAPQRPGSLAAQTRERLPRDLRLPSVSRLPIMTERLPVQLTDLTMQLGAGRLKNSLGIEY